MYPKLSGFSDEIDMNTDIQFSVLNKLGISYFEPRGIDGKNISELNDGEVVHLKNKMKMYGIQVSSIGSPIGKIKLTDDFDKHFELYKHVIKTAMMLDVRYVRIFSFYGTGNVVPAGYGDGNLEYIIGKLISGGYNGFFSLEPHLGSFDGLDALELDDSMLSLPKSGEGTFIFAFNEFCKIFKKHI